MFNRKKGLLETARKNKPKQEVFPETIVVELGYDPYVSGIRDSLESSVLSEEVAEYRLVAIKKVRRLPAQFETLESRNPYSSEDKPNG